MRKMGLGDLEPGLFFNLEGCGSQKSFYRDALKEITNVIPLLYKKFAGTSRIRSPYLIKCSIGNLKSNSKEYDAAILKRSRNPYEWGITFNQNNPEYLGPYGTAATANHEMIHILSMSFGVNLSEYDTEMTNIETLKKAGKEEIAKLTERGSGYIGKTPSCIS